MALPTEKPHTRGGEASTMSSSLPPVRRFQPVLLGGDRNVRRAGAGRLRAPGSGISPERCLPLAPCISCTVLKVGDRPPAHSIQIWPASPH